MEKSYESPNLEVLKHVREWDMTPYDEMPKIGVLDPEGKYTNPLTNQPYSKEYKTALVRQGERHWSKLDFNHYEHQKKTFETIQQNQVILIKGGTGTGKSSQVPKFVIHLLNYDGKIAITIPTQLSTQSSARKMAQDMDVKLGEEIGYKFRGTSVSDEEKTKILFTTDGSIISQLLGDNPDLNNFDALLIDEAHKRTVNIDLILLLAKKVMDKRNNFKLIIISATIDEKIFQHYYRDYSFGFVNVPKESKNIIHITYVPETLREKIEKKQSYVPMAVDYVLKALRDFQEGDILVFFPSTVDLRNACELLEQRNVEKLSFCLMASGELLGDEQKKIELQQKREETSLRKVVMATNVAEESITIDNLRFVIDSGLVNVSSYHHEKQANVLQLEFITKASAKQRAGRTGRLGEGYCYRLYTESQFQSFPDYEKPQILRENITTEILKITNNPNVQYYNITRRYLEEMIQPPPKQSIDVSLEVLYTLKCATGSSPESMDYISLIGKAIAELQIEPAQGLSLLISSQHHVRNLLSIIYSMFQGLKGKDLLKGIFGNLKEKEQWGVVREFWDNRGTYFMALKLFHVYQDKKLKYKNDFKAFDKWLKKHYLKKSAFLDAEKEHFRLSRELSKLFSKYPTLESEVANLTFEKYKRDDLKVVQSIEEGEGLIRSAKMIATLTYKTLFPSTPSIIKLSSDYRKLLSTTKNKLIYNSLFIGASKEPSFNNILLL